MKKAIISLLTILFAATLFITSCLQITTSDLLTKPTVETKGNAITISIPRQSSSTKYINVYRKDHTTEEEINIGIIYPEALSSNGSAYIYIDNLIYKNHKYSYMARYKENEDYLSTEWSNEIKAYDGYDESKSLKYNTSGVSFSYDDSNYSLELNSAPAAPDITNFTTDFKPMIIVKTDSSTQAFKIDPLIPANRVHLRDILPKAFLDKEITIVGVMAQSQEYVPGEEAKPEDQRKIKRITWIAPSYIPITGYTNRKIVIPSSEAQDGFDYSRKISN